MIKKYPNIIEKILTVFLSTIVITMVAEAYGNNPALRATAQKRMGIKVQQLTPIAFGTFASYGNGGIITIDAHSGIRTVSGTISTLSGGDYGQAEFTISGQPGEEIMISPPASTKLSNGGNSGNMIITDFKVNPSEIITLDRQGIIKIKIGAILKVPGNVPQGSYSGFFNVTARYIR